MIYLTRKETFNAAHRLYNEHWSDEQNFEVFGKCANKNWHGHNFNLFVTVKGIPNPETGFVINVKELGKIIKEKIILRLDHTNLNLDDNFLPKIAQPTCETLVVAIWNELHPILTEKGCILHAVKIQETEHITAEYFGE